MADNPGGGFYAKAYGLSEQDTPQYYADWASTYDHELVNGKGYAMPRRCAEAIDQYVPDRDTIIADLGCGTGLLGGRLKQLGYTIIDGVDYSPEMLTEAAKTGAYRMLAEANLNEPFAAADGTYGAVAVMGVFSFGHVYPAALDEMRRIVEPSGHIIIGVNEKFVEEGSLTAKLDQMVADHLIELVADEYGDHMPGSGVNGWVYVARRVG